MRRNITSPTIYIINYDLFYHQFFFDENYVVVESVKFFLPTKWLKGTKSSLLNPPLRGKHITKSIYHHTDIFQQRRLAKEMVKKCGTHIFKNPANTPKKYLRLEEVYLLLLLIELFLSKVRKHIMQTHQKINFPSYGHILGELFVPQRPSAIRVK
jgi:hypothetical protein